MLALLKRQGERYGYTKSPTASMVRQLLAMALLDLPSVERTWNATVDYWEAEGLERETARHSYLDRRWELALKSVKGATAKHR